MALSDERLAEIRERRDKSFPDSLDLTAMWRTVPELLDALAESRERERAALDEVARLRAIAEVEYNGAMAAHTGNPSTRNPWPERSEN